MNIINVRQIWHRATAHFDPHLMTIAMLLMLIGFISVFSATYDTQNRLFAQILNMAAAFVLMWLLSQVAPQTLMRYAVLLYVVGVILLVLVWFFGIKVNGARRWLNLGVGRIQPSEIMKIATPLMLAWYYHKHEAAIRFRHHLVAVILLLLPFLLIAKQPDLGTAILVGAAGFYVIFFAGFPWKFIVGLAVAAGASAPFAWNLLHDYQQRRIMTLFDPASDPLGSGYHIIQGTIAIGSGGWVGKGWLHGSQTHLDFLPEKHTDFIFAVFSEEWGLLGNTILLILYTFLIARAMMIAYAAPTLFSRLLAGAIGLILFTYAFVNMGMVSGILPVVGVPLPFISYGGTALVTLFALLGMLMSIHTHRMLVKK
ncbi:MAG TPA: rod shape-determining protein RodA [Rhodocyclaceae bacterium]|nr:rod shape-determining protein RodA [Rhodocyclaceae bacterium]